MELAFTFCLAGFSMSKHVQVHGGKLLRGSVHCVVRSRRAREDGTNSGQSSVGPRGPVLAGPGNGEGVQRTEGGGLRSQPSQRDQLCGALHHG